MKKRLPPQVHRIMPLLWLFGGVGIAGPAGLLSPAGLGPGTARATNAELYQVPSLIEPLDDLFERIEREIQRVPQNMPPVAVDPVATPFGEPTAETIDLFLGGSGQDLGYARYSSGFLSQAAAFWGFYRTNLRPHGEHWTHNFHLMIQRYDASRVLIYYKKGKVLFFEKVGGAWRFNSFLFGLTYAGTPYQMIEVGSKLEMMDPETNQILTFEFGSLGNFQIRGVERIRDRNGNAHNLSYNPDGTLALVEDGLGRSLDFDYVAGGGGPRIARVMDQSGRTVEFGYDAVGLLTSVTDVNGEVTRYTYDANRRLASIIQPEGNVVVQNAYGAGSRILTQTDGEGNVYSFSYVAGATTITDPLGGVRTHSFDGAYRLTAFTDEAGRTIDYAYDSSHRLVSTTDRMGATSTITYHEPSGHVAGRTDPGRSWIYSYEPQMQEGFTFHALARIDCPDGTFATLSRNGQGRVTAFTDREGNTTTFTYNARGQVETATNAETGVTTYSYNPDGTAASQQDPSGNVTTYDYDDQKRLVAIHRPDASTVSFTYDARGNVLSATDENGNTTSYVYDGNGNLASATDPLGQASTFVYDGNNDLVSVTDPLGRTTTRTYDAMRRVVSRTDALGHATTHTYDLRGRLVSVTDELGQACSYAHDDEGILTSATDPQGRSTLFFSNDFGQITRVRDPLGNETEYIYDALGRLIQMLDPLGRATGYPRDANGLVSRIDLAEPGIGAAYERNGLLRVETVTDPRGQSWITQYDVQSRLVSMIDPLGNQVASRYDSRSRLEQVTLPVGLGTVDYSHDAAGRLTQWSASDGTTFSFTYDGDDRLVATGGLTLGYDSCSRITQSNGLAMAYDAAGNLVSITHEPGKTVSYAYDARGLLASMADWAGGVTTFTHDGAGRLVSVAHPNGVTTSYTHDDAGRVIGIAEHDGQSNLLSSIVLVLDGDGQITQAIRNTPLTAAPDPGSTAYQYDAANRTIGHTYDALGRLLDDGIRTYTWNLADQLTGITQGGTAVGFTRDAFGNVLSRADGSATREFVWNYAMGRPTVAQEAEDGVVLRRFLTTPAGDILSSLEADGSRVVHHHDELGNTIFLTDGAGAVTRRYAYSPYGSILAESGDVRNLLTFQGRAGVMREELGPYSMRARWYDPVLGRFVSPDPIRFLDPLSLNPYQAFLGNPLAFVDPDGTNAVEAYFRGFLEVRGKIRECLGVTGGWEDAFRGALGSGLGLLFNRATHLQPPPPPQRCICLGTHGHDPVCHFGQRPPVEKGPWCTCRRPGACEPPCKGATHWLAFGDIPPTGDRPSPGGDVPAGPPAGEDAPTPSGPPKVHWDPVTGIYTFDGMSWNPADDKHDAPLIVLDPTASITDTYAFFARTKPELVSLRLVPMVPMEVPSARNAWWDPDLSRRSFDPRRAHDLLEIIR
jgi:RHS repeat-associated protein